jgi:hypothetical protein
MEQVLYYFIILLSIWLVKKKPLPKPQKLFYSSCLISQYTQYARAADLESTAYLPTGYRIPVVYPPKTIMWLMEVRDVDGKRWLKVSANTTAGYECVGWIKASLL